ncbi:Sec-independent protein translocase protein TatB [Musicola keenii]|uniref:Sec-independent protein translocase protein TatB n=1 Tax=Musicola keenii TaxID=2884250 RepID=UPI00177E76B2
MFDIGFGELLLVMVLGLVVLGPERLPVAVKTVAGWIRTLRSLASTVQNELAQEMKLQELQDSLKKVEKASQLQALSPELQASMDELKEAASAMKRSYTIEPDAGVSATPVLSPGDPEAVHDGVSSVESAVMQTIAPPPPSAGTQLAAATAVKPALTALPNLLGLEPRQTVKTGSDAGVSPSHSSGDR